MFADLRHALRQLANAPVFTAIALATLAVGIGSATVVFSAINALLFKPLPLLEATEGRLVYATQSNRLLGYTDLGWTYPDYRAVRERATTLAGIWVHSDRTVIIAGTEKPERLLGSEISWDAFGLMGVHPMHGRAFSAADALPGSENVALISAAIWNNRFQAKPEVVGTTVTLNGQPTTIVGVMPPGWRYPDYSDVWSPLRPPEDKPALRHYFSYSGRALLKPGVTLAAAQAELDAIFGAIEKEFPKTNSGIGARLRPIREEAAEDTERFTLLLFGAVCFVFLIACVNVANLLLSRAVTRSKEFAIRLALGADRARLIRQLVSESVVLGFLGGVGGLIFGLWGNDAMVAALPIDIPFWLRFDFDVRVFAFVAALSLVGAVVFGLAPALKASRPDVVMELKEGGRSADAFGPRAIRLRSALVVGQIALALVLLVGAGLMMRSFLEVRALNPGFDPRGVLTFRTGFPHAMIGDDMEKPARFFEEVLAKVRAIPGVETAALMSWRPTKTDTGHVGPLVVEGEPRPTRISDTHLVYRRVVSPEYFQALRIPLHTGRLFDDTLDRTNTQPVVLVDESFARARFGSAAAALGRQISWFEDPEAKPEPEKKPHGPATIIGVVGNIRHRLDRADKHPTVYTSHRQTIEAFQTVVLRLAALKNGADPATMSPAAINQAAREAVLAVNREIPIYEDGPLDAVLLRSDTVWPRRFFGWLFTVFGGVALFLACIGIYGVMSYNVTQRTQELGVRIALGAQPREIIQLVVRNGLRLVGFGLGAGFVAALLLVNLLTGVLYGVSPHDPPTFAVVPLLLAAVALFACWLPSRRATLIEPNAALRME